MVGLTLWVQCGDQIRVGQDYGGKTYCETITVILTKDGVLNWSSGGHLVEWMALKEI